MVLLRFSLLPLIGSALLLVGCAPRSSIAPVSSAPVVVPARSVSVSPAVLAVQSHPLYKQAEAAVTKKDTTRAVSLLK